MCSDDVVLSVKNVSKCFEMYEKPIHRLFQTFCAGRRKFYREFWALRGIDFEIHKGECVGIIGRNGAGKSTLLQIVTGTLSPTTGTIVRRGRIAALLELGSGFNPEFSGRENVYLNGAILGLSKKEIDARYEDILAFADIGEFIDQPVKTYSSGMMVRLAFAVQVMVDPDVLIVDEALAVGDVAFQRKCYMRMEALKKRGVTILLVTHGMETVKQFCSRVILLKDHLLDFDGEPEEGVTRYMRSLFPVEADASAKDRGMAASSPDTPQRTASKTAPGEYVYVHSTPHVDRNVWGSGGAVIEEIRIRGLRSPNFLPTPGRLRIEIDVRWDREFVSRKISEEGLPPNMMVGIRLADVKNVPVIGTNNALENVPIDPLAHEAVTVAFDLDLPMLRPGDLFLTAAVAIGKMQASLDLVWDDLAIQLKCESRSQSDAIVYCPVGVSVESRT